MIVTIAIMGIAFLVMYVGLAGISFEATYIIPTMIKLETLVKGSNLTIDYDSYRIKNHNRVVSIGTILATLMPLVGMIYVAYRFEEFKSVTASIICITIMVASVLLILSSSTRQKKFINLFTDVKRFIDVEGIDSSFYRSIKKFQTFQMLLMITMVIMMFSI